MIATAPAVAFVVYSCQSKIKEADNLNLDQTPSQVVNNMFVVQSENGLLQMRMEADLMERYETVCLKLKSFLTMPDTRN